MPTETYMKPIEELKRRIAAAIPDHPEILEFTDPFALYKVEGFSAYGLDVSLLHAAWALGSAQAEWVAERWHPASEAPMAGTHNVTRVIVETEHGGTVEAYYYAKSRHFESRIEPLEVVRWRYWPRPPVATETPMVQVPSTDGPGRR